jgi:hypothetical protein
MKMIFLQKHIAAMKIEIGNEETDEIIKHCLNYYLNNTDTESYKPILKSRFLGKSCHKRNTTPQKTMPCFLPFSCYS